MSSTAVSSGSIPLTHSNGHQIYNLASQKTLPEFLASAVRSKKSLRYDDEYRGRLELIQDFGFQAASVSLAVSPDGQFILASGVYPPEIRVYDVRDLGVKFSRRFDAEPVAAIFLGDDYRKIAILRNDRSVELHAQYGRHEVVRIPEFGRALAFDRSTAVLYIAGSKGSVFRLDLEQGLWLLPLSTVVASSTTTNTTTNARAGAHSTSDGAGIGSMVLSNRAPLLAVGLEDGSICVFDTRESDKPAAILHTPAGSAVTSMCFNEEDTYLAVGTEQGVVYVYDIRSSSPVYTVDHRNDSPITAVVFNGRHLVSSDRKGVKVHCEKGRFVLGVDATAPVMDVVVQGGLILCASEAPRMGIWFVPSLGPAPEWCAHLDGLVSEMKTSKEGAGIFHDYVFVSGEQLGQLGGESLIGSDLVKAHLHGYFMDDRLYRKLTSEKELFDKERYEDEQVEKLTKAKTSMRKPISKAGGGGNRGLKEQLMKKTEEITKIKKNEREIARNVLEDKRFAKLWNNPDFEIDQV